MDKTIIGISLTVLAALFAAIFLVGLKVLSNKKVNSAAIAAGYQLLGGLLLLVSIPFMDTRLSSNWEDLAFIGLAVLFWFIQSNLNAYVNNFLDISLSIVVGQLSVITVFYAQVFLFGQESNVYKFIGVLIVILSNLIIVFNGKSFAKNINTKGLLLKLLTVVTFTIAVVTDAYNMNIRKVSSINVYAMFTFIMPGLLSLILLRGQYTKALKDFWRTKYIFLMASFFTAISFLMYLKSFDYIASSVSFVVNSVYSIFIALIGIYFLGEKEHKERKLIATVIAFIGLILVNL